MKNLLISIACFIIALIIACCLIQTNGFPETLTHLEIAQAEIGKGESEGNNKGEAIRRYAQGKDDQPWCASFVSYCLNEAGITELGYPVAAKVIWNKGRKAGWQVNEPQVGDLICFWRESPHSWQGHVGIVKEVKSSEILTIEANLGDFPSLVKVNAYSKTDIPRLLGYLRPQCPK